VDLDGAIAAAEPLPAAYVLAGATGPDLYKGSCRNLCQRLKDHRAGRVAHTKNWRPLRLVYYEYCADYTLARQRENWLKSGQGRAWLKKELTARVAEWQTQRTSRLWRVRLRRKNPRAA